MSRDLTAADLFPAEAAVPATVRDQIAHVGAQLYTILAERLAATPDAERISGAQQNAREACARLRAWRHAGSDGRAAALTTPEQHAIDRLLRDVAESLGHAFGYSADERVDLRTTVLGETAAAAAERVRQQDIDAAEGHAPGWQWSLGEHDDP